MKGNEKKKKERKRRKTKTERDKSVTQAIVPVRELNDFVEYLSFLQLVCKAF